MQRPTSLLQLIVHRLEHLLRLPLVQREHSKIVDVLRVRDPAVFQSRGDPAIADFRLVGHLRVSHQSSSLMRNLTEPQSMRPAHRHTAKDRVHEGIVAHLRALNLHQADPAGSHRWQAKGLAQARRQQDVVESILDVNLPELHRNRDVAAVHLDRAKALARGEVNLVGFSKALVC